MKLVDWARNELELLNKTASDQKDNDGMQDFMNKGILQIVELFASQGHSGHSAAYALGIIKRLLDWKPILPLKGTDDEWYDTGYGGISQNKRCSAVFRKNADNTTAYYIEGRVFSDNGGITWFTGKGSLVPVEFPYHVPGEPERVYLNGEGSEEVVTDQERIKELRDEWRRKFGEAG